MFQCCWQKGCGRRKCVGNIGACGLQNKDCKQQHSCKIACHRNPYKPKNWFPLFFFQPFQEDHQHHKHGKNTRGCLITHTDNQHSRKNTEEIAEIAALMQQHRCHRSQNGQCHIGRIVLVGQTFQKIRRETQRNGSNVFNCCKFLSAGNQMQHRHTGNCQNNHGKQLRQGRNIR